MRLGTSSPLKHNSPEECNARCTVNVAGKVRDQLAFAEDAGAFGVGMDIDASALVID